MERKEKTPEASIKSPLRGMEASDKLISDSITTAQQSVKTADQILNRLHQDRENIEASRATLKDIDGDMTRASGHVGSMTRKIFTNQLVLVLIIILLLVAIMVVIGLRWVAPLMAVAKP